MQLKPGQNTPLTSTTPSIKIATQAPPGFELDPSAFSLTASGKVEGDHGMTFYGQPNSRDGSVIFDANGGSFDLNLSMVPASIEKIAICLTIHEATQRGQRFSQTQNVLVSIQDGGNSFIFSPPVGGMSESALILGEIYKRNGQWKFRAIGQGFNGGLAPLATNFGVDISDDSSASKASPAPQPPTPSTPPPPPPKPRVDLTKITLEKSKPVDLRKNDGKFGRFVINLNWNQKPAGLAGMFKAGIDLDLGCMYQHSLGRKGVVQALGNTFGSFNGPDFCELRGDDRSGASREGEFLDINGEYWDMFDRILIFAFIYEGVPNWSSAGARVKISIPGQPELEALIDSPNNRDTMCAIATLENINGAIRATKHVRYYPSHKEMDEDFGFGFTWRAGRK